MKRVLTILALLLLPLSVWAMTPVSDSDLSNVTGQAGVNINADLTMNVRIGTMAWGDSDGITVDGSHGEWAATASGGYVGIKDFNLTNIRIKARETDTFNGYIPYADPDSNPVTPAISDLKPITIDVAQDPAMYSGWTFVRFGLGSLEISLNAMSFTVAISDGYDYDEAENLGLELGSVNLGDMHIYINPASYVDIYAHAGQGVNMTFNITLDEITLGYVSWGDSDGLPDGSTNVLPWMYGSNYSTALDEVDPGYIGIDDLHLGVVTVTGTVAIDVVTTRAGIYAHGAYGITTDAAPVTVCHISFPDLFNVEVDGPITGIVKLDSVAALNSANAGTLGDIYISGFGLDIYANSWVDIWAH